MKKMVLILNVLLLTNNIYAAHSANDAQEQINKYVSGEFKDFIHPLHRAVKSGDVEMVELLLKSGIDVNFEDEYKATPLHYATLLRDIEIIKLLVSNGANVNAEDEHGRIPINCIGYMSISSIGIQNENSDYIYTNSLKNYNRILRLLLSLGSNPNHQDKSGNTMLHYIVRQQDEQCAYASEPTRLLLSYGADINIQNNNQETVLHSIIKRKRKNGAFILNYNRWSMSQCRDRYPGILKHIELLIGYGANIEIKDCDDNNFLDYIICKELKEYYKSLYIDYLSKIKVDKDNKEPQQHINKRRLSEPCIGNNKYDIEDLNMFKFITPENLKFLRAINFIQNCTISEYLNDLIKRDQEKSCKFINYKD